MALLSRDSILKAQDVATKDVQVPEWGGAIRVRSMTVAERNEFARRSAAEGANAVGVSAWLVSVLAVDESGARLFTPEDVQALEARNFKAVDTVVNAILEVNAMGVAAVEAAAKN
jgi:hypothetical protein